MDNCGSDTSEPKERLTPPTENAKEIQLFTRTSIKSFAGTAIGSLALIPLSSEAKAFSTASVTAGGTQHNLTDFQGDYNSNITKLETLPTIG